MPASETRILLKYADEPGYTPSLASYLKAGGYAALRKALAMKPEDVRTEVKNSGLRGRGGAGFPCGTKWELVDRKSGKPIYLICNCDESEPGTFKDRQLVHKDPHQLIEGMMISCFANDVKLAFIYIREEMPKEHGSSSARSRRRGRRVSSARTSAAPPTPATSSSTAARAPTSAARKPG